KKNVPMRHYDRDIFTYELETENLTGPSGLTFGVGPEGKASTVLVENLNDNGQGLFWRAEKKD
ncbi:MAG TPA: hypothetical protein V6C72_17085, partial [Chroococcales cyanobacterium]